MLDTVLDARTCNAHAHAPLRTSRASQAILAQAAASYALVPSVSAQRRARAAAHRRRLRTAASPSAPGFVKRPLQGCRVGDRQTRPPGAYGMRPRLHQRVAVTVEPDDESASPQFNIERMFLYAALPDVDIRLVDFDRDTGDGWIFILRIGWRGSAPEDTTPDQLPILVSVRLLDVGGFTDQAERLGATVRWYNIASDTDEDMAPPKVKSLNEKQERRRRKTGQKAHLAGDPDRQREGYAGEDSEVLSEWEEDGDATAAEPVPALSGDVGDTVSEPEQVSTASSGGRHLTNSEIEKLIEVSQTRIGNYLLEQSEKRMEQGAQQMLDKYDKKATQRLREAQQEVTKDMESKLEACVSTSENAMASMLKEAKEAARAATEAVEALSASSSSHAHGPQRGDAGARHGGADRTGERWGSKTIEIKGICVYADRYTEGVSAEYAVALETRLGSLADLLDWPHSRTANRYTFNFKMVLVLCDRPDANEGISDRERQESTRELKGRITEVFKDKEFFAIRLQLFAVILAPPLRRELYAIAAKFTWCCKSSRASTSRRLVGSTAMVGWWFSIGRRRRRRRRTRMRQLWVQPWGGVTSRAGGLGCNSGTTPRPRWPASASQPMRFESAWQRCDGARGRPAATARASIPRSADSDRSGGVRGETGRAAHQHSSDVACSSAGAEWRRGTLAQQRLHEE